MDAFLSGLMQAFSPNILLWNFIGVAAGILVGSIPGLTATMAIAILVPFTFGMSPAAGLSMLLGIYTGTMYGVGIPAVLLRIPGNPSGIMTVKDGYPMAQKGEAGRAIGIVAWSSFVGGFLGILALVLMAQPISKVALKFGPAEMFAVAIWGLASVSDLTGDELLFGVFSGLIGLLLGVVGMDPITGVPRFIFGQSSLMGGIEFIPVLIGLFGVAELLRQVQRTNLGEVLVEKVGKMALSLKDIKQIMPATLRATLIGLWVGVLPGATGGSMASILAYNYEQKQSKHPEKFGTGIPEGIAASEAANNAVIGGNLVPLLTLGIPGDTVTALLIGAFMIQGLQPGPLLYKNSPDLVYTIYVALMIANFFMMIIGIFGARIFAQVTRVPLAKLLPVVGLLCITGAYAVNGNLFDIFMMIVFGIVGYLMDYIKMPIPPLIMGLVLGPMAERNLRTALQLSHNDWSVFLTRPFTVLFWVLTVAMIVGPRIDWKKLWGRGTKAA